MENVKTIKQVDTHRYRVELVQSGDEYVIHYESKLYGVPSKSELIKDFNFASFLFDMKIDEFEGN